MKMEDLQLLDSTKETIYWIELLRIKKKHNENSKPNSNTQLTIEQINNSTITHHQTLLNPQITEYEI